MKCVHEENLLSFGNLQVLVKVGLCVGITSSGLTLTVEFSSFPSVVFPPLLPLGCLTFSAINIQLIYAQTRGQTTQPVQRFPLRDLFSRGVYQKPTVVKSLREQDTGVVGVQPLLGIVFESQMDAWPYLTYVSRVISSTIGDWFAPTHISRAPEFD